MKATMMSVDYQCTSELHLQSLCLEAIDVQSHFLIVTRYKVFLSRQAS